MNSPNYVWEKMYVAINCLCDGDDPFISRLENATISALSKLEDNDLEGELAEDLRFIFEWTKNNMINGKIQKEPDELKRKELIEKMLHITMVTHRK